MRENDAFSLSTWLKFSKPFMVSGQNSTCAAVNICNDVSGTHLCTSSAGSNSRIFKSPNRNSSVIFPLPSVPDNDRVWGFPPVMKRSKNRL